MAEPMEPVRRAFEPFPAEHQGGGPSHAYPRPQHRRAAWQSLDGEWEFAFDADARWRTPGDARFDRTIRVPFAPETEASGVRENGFFRACWYRRTFRAPPLRDGERLLLHFGAVDHTATVWVNGSRVVHHEGG